jgi:DNA-binding SARP family transcriptional activator
LTSKPKPDRSSPPLTKHEFSALGEFVFALESGQFPDAVSVALDRLRSFVGAQAVESFLLDVRGGECLPVGFAGQDKSLFQSRSRFPVGEGLAGWVAATEKSHAFDLRRKDPWIRREGLFSAGYRRVLAVPVGGYGECLGSLHFFWKEGFVSEEEGRVVVLAQAAARALFSAVSAVRQSLLCSAVQTGEEQARSRTLVGFVEGMKAAVDASLATLVVLSPEGIGIMDRISTESEHLSCAALARSALCDCPGRLSKNQVNVMSGRRANWPRECRGFDSRMKTILEIPVDVGERVRGVLFLGWERDCPQNALRLAAWGAAVARHFGPEIRMLEQSLPSRDEVAIPVEESRLQIRCLGPLDVYVEGALVPERAFGRTKAVELLALLVTREGRGISREALVEHLWPGTDFEQGVPRLHVTMHALRKAVEPPDCGRSWVHVKEREGLFYLSPESNCWVDLVAFKTFVSKGRVLTGEGDSEQALSCFLRAINLARGALFSDRLSWEWADPQRVAWQDDLLDVLLCSADLAMDLQKVGLAVSLVRQAVRVDPFRQDIGVVLNRFLKTAGDVVNRHPELREAIEALPDKDKNNQALDSALFRALFSPSTGCL